ncbi:VapA/VapB family virulence-associated protein [Xenorhabdus khoisanae]|uniref:Uncharacterized protein n=1 Tax=Xenorhabdus khoisanae TaxID=880157 RepID=A0A0J5FX20_9GAMM|nr:VapA/VapB family virulence-associated protein [Xenorhabdus khoisanae]KMJ46756.1 hypothetical protein AB204_02000 [Xenorhabdus khoisanae]
MKDKTGVIDFELIEIIKEDINSKFHQDMKGVEIDPLFINDPAERIFLTIQSKGIEASASIISEGIYFRLNVTVDAGSKIFKGQGWSLISRISGGKFSGSLYSGDLAMLYVKAHKFWFYEFLTLVFVTFYDNELKYLGVFKGKGRYTLNDIGSGSGILY